MRVPSLGREDPLEEGVCLENPMDRGAWWAAVHGVTEGRTRLSDFTFTFPQKSPNTPGSPEGNTEGPGTSSSEPLLPS